MSFEQSPYTSAGSNAGPPRMPPPLPRASSSVNFWKFLGKGAIGCAGVGVAILIIICAIIGVRIQTGDMPNTAAIADDQLPAKISENLRDFGVIKEGEVVRYFYSLGFLSIREDGNLFTDTRVISYEENEAGNLEIESAAWSEIKSMEFEKGTWLDDSWITIIKQNDDEFYLLVSTENDGDDKFYTELQKIWKANRDDPKPPEQPASGESAPDQSVPSSTSR